MIKTKIIKNLKECVYANWQMISERTDTEVSVTLTDDTIIFDFKGSHSVKDWKQNFDFMPVYYGTGIIAHKGFVDKWNSIKTFIFDMIGKNIDKDILLRGFSQGAALAQLANVVLSTIYSKNIKTIAYASPNVFHHKSKVFYGNNEITIIDLARDPVTFVPPGFLGYKKFGDRIVIDKNRPWYEWILPYLSEHSPENYIKEIERWV